MSIKYGLTEPTEEEIKTGNYKGFYAWESVNIISSINKHCIKDVPDDFIETVIYMYLCADCDVDLKIVGVAKFSLLGPYSKHIECETCGKEMISASVDFYDENLHLLIGRGSDDGVIENTIRVVKKYGRSKAWMMT